MSYNPAKKREELTFICSEGEYDQRENYGYFYLSINDKSEWESRVDIAEDLSCGELGISRLWGLHFDPTVFECDELYHTSEYCEVNATRIVLLLRAASYLFSLKAAAKDITCLDYYLPIYSNVLLAGFLLFTFFSK